VVRSAADAITETCQPEIARWSDLHTLPRLLYALLHDLSWRTP